MRIIRLIVAPECDAIALTQGLADRVGLSDREKLIEFIEMVLVYKFPQMSREEAVFGFEKVADLDLWLKGR
jgi:predicted transposase YdaD